MTADKNSMPSSNLNLLKHALSEQPLSQTAISQCNDWLQQYRFGLRVAEVGYVVSVGDGITWISGLPSAAIDEILSFADGSSAVVFDLSQQMVGTVLLRETEQLKAGTSVQHTPYSLSIPVGDGLLSRVVDPLGNPLDNKGPLLNVSAYRPIHHESPAITAREFVNRPLYTGIKVIDALIPIGKGQRQLIIGDQGLGRSSVAMDTIINQRGKHVYCVYVLIGQKRSTVISTIETLREFNALDYTTIVVAEGSTLPGLQHFAPFAGCTIAEAWMEQGHDTLIVYDDLTTHAKKYRELSLLLRRPPGREAYPGDIFSVHARLLERSTSLNTAQGGGSLTALPIIETLEGEIAAYIPTNLISITDGQIYLDQELFSSGVRPAVDIARSVSRIGGQAQHPCIKVEAGRMKLDYLQFLELETFTRFGAKLEESMEVAIRRGRVLRAMLKQERLTPCSIEFQLACLVAFNDRLFDDIPPEKISFLLNNIMDKINKATLTLDSERTQWSQFMNENIGASVVEASTVGVSML